MIATDHVFRIEFKCTKCDELQMIEKKISDILSDICEAGWPICQECGDDMEANVAS